MYSRVTHISEITRNLENDISIVLKWIYSNGMVANPDKCQLTLMGLNEKHKLRLNIEGKKISSNKHIKLPGIEIENQLRFSKHIQKIC